MTNGQVLIVSMLGDGPYWQSALEILTPPVGCSFYRPFSYRIDWVGNSVLDNLKEDEQLECDMAVLGMRFRSRDEAGELVEPAVFIPLRQASATLIRQGDVS